MAAKRLLSLDVMRGITVAAMIVVNNAGGPESFGMLRHSAWNGLTLCDLVFPFFLFIVGVTTYLSMSKSGFRADRHVVTRILRRALLIILIGWALHWVELVFKGRPLDFAHLRLTGVLPRIGLCFGIVSLLSLCMGRRAMAWTAAALLVVYAALVCIVNGYSADATNVNAIVDRFLIGADHLYHKSPIDPEGLVGTLPAVAHTMIGFCCGAVIRRDKPLADRVCSLFAIGFALAALGFILSDWLPLNKRIWSPTYCLTTTGTASMLLAVLIYVVDMLGRRRWCPFFESFGVNPLFLYVLSEFLAIVVGRTGVKAGVYAWLEAVIPDPRLASAVYAVTFMLLLAAAALPLYRRRIYIKL